MKLKLILSFFFVFFLFLFIQSNTSPVYAGTCTAANKCGECLVLFPFCGAGKYCDLSAATQKDCGLGSGRCCSNPPQPTPTPIPPKQCNFIHLNDCNPVDCPDGYRCVFSLGNGMICQRDASCNSPTAVPTPSPIPPAPTAAQSCPGLPSCGTGLSCTAISCSDSCSAGRTKCLVDNGQVGCCLPLITVTPPLYPTNTQPPYPPTVTPIPECGNTPSCSSLGVNIGACIDAGARCDLHEVPSCGSLTTCLVGNAFKCCPSVSNDYGYTPTPIPSATPTLTPTPIPPAGGTPPPGSCIPANSYCTDNPSGCCSGTSCAYSPSEPGKMVCYSGGQAGCSRKVCGGGSGYQCVTSYYNATANGCSRPDNCKTEAECLGGGPPYTGNTCECIQCNVCNTSADPTKCAMDWNCVANNPTCAANISQSCSGGTSQPYAEDTGSPSSATFTNPGDSAVFAGGKSYTSANWQFQWTSTPKACGANYQYFAWLNGNWSLVGFQDVNSTYCQSSACTFTATLNGSGKILIRFNGYKNDQTGCTMRVSSVKLRYSAPAPTGSPWPACATQKKGDTNCDGVIDVKDLAIWVQQFASGGYKADFNHDRKVDLSDFEIWRTNAYH